MSRPTFVVADAHGNLDAVTGLLRQTGILDDDLRRRDRDTYVVQIGDLCNCVAESIDADHRCLDRVEDWFDAYLVGNHEYPYFGGIPFAGFFHDAALGHRLELLNAKHFVRPCVFAGDVLVSHAGVAAGISPIASAPGFAGLADSLWRSNPTHALFSRIGPTRGGRDGAGGILWSDWSEPKSEVFPQVVGHTAGGAVRWQGTTHWYAVCIDLGAKNPGSSIAGAWIRDGVVDVEVYEPTPVPA